MKYNIDKPPNADPDARYILRLFDMFDGWLSASRSMTWTDAVNLWSEKTNKGTKMTSYADGDYWDIFPAGTQMLMTPEYLGR